MSGGCVLDACRFKTHLKLKIAINISVKTKNSLSEFLLMEFYLNHETF